MVLENVYAKQESGTKELVNSDSPVSTADHLLDVLYDGATSDEDMREAHGVYCDWFMRQPADFRRMAYARYAARREQVFESMYSREAVS